MQKKFLITLTALVTAIGALAWVPMVRTFPAMTYGAGAQNWAVAQDSLGRMYFGNREGLLTFNSCKWSLSRIPNFSTVRSILIDNAAERIYVGASDEFGYFEVLPENGRRVYRSLVETIEPPGRSFTEIWNIHRDKENIWFQSDFCIFRFNGEKSVAIPLSDKITTSSLINGRLYAGLLKQGLVIVNDRRVTPVEGTESLCGKRIVAVLPGMNGGLLVVTDFNGLFEVKDGVTTPSDLPVSDFLRHNQAFCATFNPRTRQYAFGTVNAGAVIIEPQTPQPVYVSIATGMQNNTVLGMSFDREGNLWLALDNGIDYAVTNSAIHPLPFPGAIYGAGYTSLLRDNRLLLGTNRGLYSFEFPYPAMPPSGSEQPPLIKGQIWSTDTVGSDILVSGDAGLFYSIDGVGFRPVEGVSAAWCVRPVPGSPRHAIASTYNGFILLQRDPGGWSVKNRISGSKDAAGQFHFDGAGNLWIAHWMRGIYHLTLNDSLTAFTRERLFTTQHGLPSNRNNIVSSVDGHLVFSTENGFYRYDEKRNRFLPYERYNEMFTSHQSARLYQARDHEVWSVSPDNVWRATMAPAGGYDVDTTTFQPLGSKLIPGFDHLEFINPQRAIMASQEGFYDIAINYTDPSPVEPSVFVSRITANQDSVIYEAPLEALSENIRVPYTLNSLKFEFITPEYRAHNAVTYSYMLDGYDSDWSSWSTSGEKEYTKLHEGSYTLCIKSYDRYTGRTALTEFRFTVAPPWYRSATAYVVYILLLLALGWFVYKLYLRNNRRLTLAVEQRKEQEMAQMKRDAAEEALRKDYEIAHLKSQQLEHDIKHKSEELSNITMNVIRKNEMLLDISGKLTKLQDSLGESGDDSAKQFSHIQKLIQDNISHDDDWRSFTRNFDIVYENYTKRLTELHPELNASDLRICCYLKMGLSSKEIAPLFNISYRSVEMTRYRLRKKMGLSRETNLAEYLQKI